MKKILIVMLALYNGGAERSLINMLNELPEDKYEIDLLLFRKEGMFLSQVPSWVNLIDQTPNLRKLYAPLRESGNMMFTKLIGTAVSNIRETGAPGMKIGYRWNHFYSRRIEKNDKKYDVAIAYVAGEPMYYICDKVVADKKIVWIHTDFRSARYPKKYFYEYFKQMELVTVSEECAQIVEEEFSEFNKKVYNIANITSSVVTKKKADEYYPSEFDREKIKILSVGRLSREKGFDLAIEAAELLKKRKVEFKWYIVGEGKLREKLQASIEKKGLNNQFILLGSRENPYPYIKNCDIFVQTSRFEGKSVVLDEAKILAAPIVVTNYPTVHDVIAENEGMIVELTKESIADGLEKMIKDREFRESYKDYLSCREYGNQDEIKKYMEVIGE